jgi:hypothetical protein
LLNLFELFIGIFRNFTQFTKILKELNIIIVYRRIHDERSKKYGSHSRN